jgi:GNAT superfamily N-acetyltransferase
MSITLSPFTPADQPAVKALVLAGLADHWGTLDLSKNPDLNDIAATYKGAYFLVAKQAGEVVGCGALVPRTPDSAEVVRMSVAAAARRQGLGRRILSALCRAKGAASGAYSRDHPDLERGDRLLSELASHHTL